MAISNYTKSGTRATTAAKLPKAVFGVKVQNHELLKSAYVAYLANARQSDAQSKTRGQVSGGGRKPWKQKGTGRARFGSSRNPIWRGGGIVFGPTGNENYSHKLSTAAKRQAIRQALSLAADENRIKVIESLESKTGKTKQAVELLNKIEAAGSVLIVVNTKTTELIRATRNIDGAKLVAAKYVNVFDAMNADVIVVESEALKTIEEWLGGTK